MLIKSFLFVLLFLFLFRTNAESSRNIHIKVSDENYFTEDLSITKRDKKLLLHSPPNNDIELGLIKEKLTNSLIDNFRKNLRKRYKKSAVIELEISNANIFFHSIDSYYLESFDYKINQNGQNIISASFSQARDCSNRDSFYKSVCGIPEIARFLFTKIQERKGITPN